VTAQFRRSGTQFPQDFDQGVDRDALWVSVALVGLPVEVPAIDHSGVCASEHNAQLFGRTGHHAQNRLGTMNVLMRVQMGRIAAHQLPEGFQLPGNLPGNRGRVTNGNHLIHRPPRLINEHPLTQINVKSNGQSGMAPGIGRCRLGLRGADHQAGARDDPLLMRPDDSTIHSPTEPKVIGVDYQTA
jgi:hypothetical protein